MNTESFPRLSARTRRFTLGAPREVAVVDEGDRVLFLRSGGGTDPVTCLWELDLRGEAVERLIADPDRLLGGAEDDVPPAERRRRERAREQAGGVTAYATSADATVIVFALAGRLWVATAEGVRELPAEPGVTDPHPDPTGRRIAYSSGGSLCVVDVDGGNGRRLAEPDGAEVSWGLAEFVAAEEMGRSRGFWWAPDGESLAVARVDAAGVTLLHIADPAHPERPAAQHRYPAAGTPNAKVSLHVVGLDGARIEVDRDNVRFPYLAGVLWSAHGLVATVQARDQRTLRYLRADPSTGETEPVRADDTDTAWVDLVAGVPGFVGGTFVRTADVDDTRRLMYDDRAVSDVGLQVHAVLSVDDDGVLFTGSTEPVESHVYLADPAGAVCRLTDTAGVHTAARAGRIVAITSADLDTPGCTTRVLREGAPLATIANHAAVAPIEPRVTMLRAGTRELRTAVLWPTGYRRGSGRLPVLLDPYGGPHAQRVRAARSAYLASQWLADQGFAVVVADGRGTPGRGAAWDRAVAGDLATPALEDQVDALHAVAERYVDLDLERVAIRGWSFGGYLAALAVLRRPDVFHAAVAGAPVTEWRLYDTHYTERYLGDPAESAANYERSSLLPLAPDLGRPLMLIHGMADDNVVVAHTLALSGALLAAGRPHRVLPLSGISHMTPQEVIAENLLRLELAFFAETLGSLDPATG
ncbi:MAG: S9 family peptidase [Pseudonocardiales bacterium]|nr:MAG: S9 family peptidase [Pseudonocardiales bacterium]